MSKINWDSVANNFADHDAAIERRTQLYLEQHRQDIEYMQQMSEKVLREIPKLLFEHLRKRRDDGRDVGDWLFIWGWTNRDSWQDRGLGVCTTLEAMLEKEGIRTKQETGGDESYTGWELYANISDLRRVAQEQINKPRVEISGRGK